jgi:phenylpropionate dioxygenase-like ring-hydroxylating dioxygenase large terminal subunit
VQLREFDGEIHALENVCPHRGGPFVLDDLGESPVVCKYHGLSFHGNGSFKASASADWFCKDSPYDELDCLAIKKFRTKEIGEFVFVSLGNDVAFEDQFNDEMIMEMQKIKFHPHFGQAKWEEQFNWKLNFENIKDPLHIYYIHPKTFGHLLAFNSESYISRFAKSNKDLEGKKIEVSPKCLQDMSFMGYSNAMDRPRVWWESDIENLYREQSYVNFYFFPSTNFYSVGGTHFARQTYDPSGPSSFNYSLEVYLPALTKKISAAPLIKRLMEIEKVVIDEDSIILKEVKKSTI